MTEQQLRTIIAQTAMAEVGYVGPNGYTCQPPYRVNKYAEYLDKIPNVYSGKKNGYHWCAIFVDYIQMICMGREIMEIATNHHIYGCDCDWGARQYDDRAKLFARNFTQPEVGDEVFYFKNGEFTHTGIVVSVDNEKFGSVEGNCSNSVKLYYKRWDANDGYRHYFASPDYAKAAEILSELSAPTEREMNEHEKWAIENGLIVGDGNGNYNFDEPIKRGHLCSVLFQMYQKFMK